MPAPQYEHALAPVLEYCALLQLKQAVEPVADVYDPEKQFEQLVAEVDPVVVRKVPDGHPVQLDVPMLTWYIPAAQKVQEVAPDDAEKLPLAQNEQLTEPELG